VHGVDPGRDPRRERTEGDPWSSDDSIEPAGPAGTRDHGRPRDPLRPPDTRKGEIARLPSRAMADDTTTVAALKARVADFVHAREWEKFHRTANLAKAISVEAAELLELFQWREDSQPLDAATRHR